VFSLGRREGTCPDGRDRLYVSEDSGRFFLAFVSALYYPGLCAGNGQYDTSHVFQFSIIGHAGSLCIISDHKNR